MNRSVFTQVGHQIHRNGHTAMGKWGALERLRRPSSPRQLSIQLIVLGVFLAACVNGVDSKADRSFLTDDPCAAPCWHGLKLNQSTEADVLATLATLEFVDPNDIRLFEGPWANYDLAQAVWFGCLHPRERDCGVAYLVNDRLKSLRVIVGYPLMLGEVAAKLGEPEYVEYGDYHFEVGGCVAHFFWPATGVVVAYSDTRDQAVCQALKAGDRISPDLSIEAVMFVSAEGFESEPGGCCTRIAWPGLSDP